jgi:hypothetical protein
MTSHLLVESMESPITDTSRTGVASATEVVVEASMIEVTIGTEPNRDLPIASLRCMKMNKTEMATTRIVTRVDSHGLTSKTASALEVAMKASVQEAATLLEDRSSPVT